MSQRFVALEDVLRALEQAGPLSSDALARRLRLNRLDARLVLVDAHAHGLVRTTGRGDWAITAGGREALAEELGEGRHPRHAEESWWRPGPYLERIRAFTIGSSWRGVFRPRYLARRGLPVALGTIACAGGVAVASSGLEGAAPAPIIATPKAKAPAHTRHAHAPVARHFVATGVIATHRHSRSALVTATGTVRHLRGHVLAQAPRRTTAACARRRVAHAAGAHLAGVCASVRRVRPRSTRAGAGPSSRRRRPHKTGSDGSRGGSPTVSSTSSTGT
jgi:hypothetical protein